MIAPQLHLDRLALALIACTLTGCSPSTGSAAGPTTAIKGDDVSGPIFDARADAEQRPGAAVSEQATCVVRQAARTFVGLQNSASLDAFEATAREAERLLATSKIALCRLSAAQDRDGTLRAALSGGVVEISAVRFQRADLSDAVLDVHTAAAGGDAPSALETRWRVHVRRIGSEWQVVSAARQKAKRH